MARYPQGQPARISTTVKDVTGAAQQGQIPSKQPKML